MVSWFQYFDSDWYCRVLSLILYQAPVKGKHESGVHYVSFFSSSVGHIAQT